MEIQLNERISEVDNPTSLGYRAEPDYTGSVIIDEAMMGKADPGGVRVNNAIESLAARPLDVRGRLKFERASATELPFREGTFSHVWSQATIYHVHDKERALQEA